MICNNSTKSRHGENLSVILNITETDLLVITPIAFRETMEYYFLVKRRKKDTKLNMFCRVFMQDDGIAAATGEQKIGMKGSAADRSVGFFPP